MNHRETLIELRDECQVELDKARAVVESFEAAVAALNHALTLDAGSSPVTPIPDKLKPATTPAIRIEQQHLKQAEKTEASKGQEYAVKDDTTNDHQHRHPNTDHG